MNYQQIVAPGAALLAILALWKRHDIQNGWQAITGGATTNWQPIGADVGMAVVFVVLLSFFAGINPDTGKIGLALLIALYILLLMNSSIQQQQMTASHQAK